MNKTFKGYSRVLLPALILISFSLSSCYKDRFDLNRLEENGEWAPEVAAPLIYSNMTMKDILNDYDHNNLFVEDATHFLYLVYWNKVYSVMAEDLIQIPVQTVNTSFDFSVPGSLPWGTDVTAPPYSADYSFTFPNGEIVDELHVKQNTLFRFVVSSNLNHNATIHVDIPAATLNGVSFSRDIEFIAGSATQETFNLAGYKIAFTQGSGFQNRISMTYTVTVHGNGSPNNSPYHVDMGESFDDIAFSKIIGDLKQQSFNMPGDSIRIRIFDNNIHGMIDFENPMIHVFAQNSFGMPIRINFSNFHSTSGYNPPYDVVVTGYPSPWDINHPSMSQMGQNVQTEFHLSKANSNVWNAIAISPQWFVTDIAGVSNPGGSPASNFVLDTSRFGIDAQIELPLFGKAWDFVLQDTMELSFGEDIDQAEYILFRLNTVNGFPVDAIQQVYFLDEFNVVVDSLLTPAQMTVSAAPVGGAPDYRVYEKTHKLTETAFEKNRIANLSRVERAVIRARLNTLNAGSQVVKLFSDYSIEVRLGARIKFRIVY